MTSRLTVSLPPGWDRALTCAGLLDALDSGWWRATADPAVDTAALDMADPALSLLGQRHLTWEELQRRACDCRSLPPAVAALAKGTPEACGLSGSGELTAAMSLVIRARRMAVAIPGTVPWRRGASPWRVPGRGR